MPVLDICKPEEVLIKIEGAMLGTTFPIISQWYMFVAMVTKVLARSDPKMLYINLMKIVQLFYEITSLFVCLFVCLFVLCLFLLCLYYTR